jgi:hypothetical protein
MLTERANRGQIRARGILECEPATLKSVIGFKLSLERGTRPGHRLSSLNAYDSEQSNEPIGGRWPRAPVRTGPTTS